MFKAITFDDPKLKEPCVEGEHQLKKGLPGFYCTVCNAGFFANNLSLPKPKHVSEWDEEPFLQLWAHPKWAGKPLEVPAHILVELAKLTYVRALSETMVKTQHGVFEGQTVAHAAAWALLREYNG